MADTKNPGDELPNDQSEGHWENVADVTQIDDGQAIEVVVRGNVIAIFNDNGDFYALDGLCAHQGGPVANGELSKTDKGKTCVTCPWHGWQYELETGIQTVNRQPLQRTFGLRVHEGRIWVQV